MIRKLVPELGILILLLLLPLLLFAPVALGPKTLLPADILFSDEPYRAAADELGVSHPQNHLLADLVLENYAWKRFLVEAFRSRQLPLWDPMIFSGHPFLANGQHSALYPLSILFYVLPLWRAYGIYTWLQLGLAGTFAYLFARVLGIRRLGGLIAGITFQFSGFMLVSVVHPMIIAGASWQPFILAMVELVVQQRRGLGERPTSLPWALVGAVGLGCQMLAGHAENTYFVLLVIVSYAAWRLGGEALSRRLSRPALRRHEPESSLVRPALWLLLMMVLGLALGAVQFVPLYEVVSISFRGGEQAASLRQVLGWAYPPRRLVTFAVPNFFGSPAHHAYFDLFSWSRTAAPERGDGRYIYWGIKNYVEGGCYLGLLPLCLSVIAVIAWVRPHVPRDWSSRAGRAAQRPERRSPYGRGRESLPLETIPFFATLSLFSLGCIFGTPLYAIVYALPFLKQSHSPFRWVFPLTLCVALLAGFGVEVVQGGRKRGAGGDEERTERERSPRGDAGRAIRPPRSWIGRLFTLNAAPSLVSIVAALAFWGGVVTLVGLGLSRIFFAQVEPLVERVFLSLAGAPAAFPGHRAFYSYEFAWIALFGLLLTATGIVLRVSCGSVSIRGRPLWAYLAVGLLVLDFVSFGRGFHAAVDPTLLAHTPPVVSFLREDDSLWRYAAFTPTGTTKTMRPNVGMFYNLQAVAGYDSLFSDQYRDYMALIEPQDETQYNLIASFREHASLDSPLTDHLNVKYIVTEAEIESPKYAQVYQDEAVRVYENLGVMPRAFTLPTTAVVRTDDFGSTVQEYDPRRYVILEEGTWGAEEGEGEQRDPRDAKRGTHVGQTVVSTVINEVFVDAEVGEPSWLILADSYFPGWKAFVRPEGAGEGDEEELEIHRVNGNFRGVLLEEPGAWTVRFRYSPNSVKIGAFMSFIAGMTMLFLAGLYLWRTFYRAPEDANTVQRVAKNSVAPMVLNFFNRLIDFAFAALMARILGPGGMGRYFTAANIYLWFDTLANFGLDMYLMREVSQERERARQIFASTTLLRLLLFTAVIPILGSFLAARQGLQNPLTADTIWAVVLLYVGLLPGTIANSLTALFRAFEMHEYPAAIQTVTTIIRVTLGTLALVGGLGIIGLAGGSILTNIATMVILAVLAWRLIGTDLPRAGFQFAWPTQRKMLIESWPLMASLLLQSLFTGANVVLLQYFRGDEAVGWYNSASKWVMNMLNIIPSLFTFAVFPVLARQAAVDRARLRRSYHLSVKLLTVVALPTAVLMTLLATPLVWVLSGPLYLPHGAIALRLLVWSIVLGWINSLTNYVLIALNRQGYVVWASAARVVFAVVANLLLVPRFSYVASAWIIIGGELLLNVLFAFDVRRHLGSVAWGEVLGRPALAGLAMGAAAWAVGAYSGPLALIASLVVYVAAVILLRVLTHEERSQLASLLPAPLRKALGGVAPGSVSSQ
ncbi:MAG: oligosaccharide flippase family protein [Anaerolineae bacterium]|jgi:O-antigen/teichoic acid export membrane protein